MLPEFSRAFNKLEDVKRELLLHLDNLSEQERSKAAHSNELSPIQILAHLVMVEETVSGPGTAPNPGLKVGMKGRIFMATMVNLMRPGFRIPTTSLLHPKVPDSYEKLKQKWTAARTALAARIEPLSESTQDQAITNHMMAGPLSAPMALDFLEVHLNYHWKNFPKTNSAPSTQRK